MKRMVLGSALGMGLVLLMAGAEPSLARSRKQKAIDDLMSQGKRLAQEALVKAPQDQEVCFAPDEPCDLKLVKFVDTAQASIDVAIFDLNLDQVVHHLLTASKSRHVKLRVLVDRRQAKGENSLVPLLIKAGVDVKIGRQRGIMHNKFMIVDGKMVETGSFNYTNGAAFNNNENQVYLANPAIVERYRRRFEEIWRAGTPPPVSKE